MQVADIGKTGGRPATSMSVLLGWTIYSEFSLLKSSLKTCVVPLSELMITVSWQPRETSEGVENWQSVIFADENFPRIKINLSLA